MGNGRGLLLAAAAFTCWGLLSPGNEILLREMTPMWLQTFRAVLASLAVLFWVGKPGLVGAWRILQDQKMFVALAMGTFLSFGFFVLSQTRIEAAYTTLGFYTAPLWTALFGWLLLREGVGVWFLPAVAVMLLGGWLALTGGGQVASPDALGMALAVASGAFWGIYAVLLRRDAGRLDWRHLLLASMLIGVGGFGALALYAEPLPDVAGFSATTWGWTLIQVAIPTLAALGMFQLSLRMVPAAQVNILVGLELAGTVFFAWLLLDFTFGALELAGVTGCLLAVSGYLWIRSYDARRQQAADQQ